jgi:DNA-binding GntR family transcriptional regulator
MGADGARGTAEAALPREDVLDAVLLARIAPGSRIGRKAFAIATRATQEEVDAALRMLERLGLVRIDGDELEIAGCDPQAILASIDRRIELETKIVRAAAQRATDVQLQDMQDSQALQKRCALVGDMDGLMNAERGLEDLLIAASGLPAEGAELKRIKIEFRRAWCAVNRLRTFSGVADIRTALVAAIAARDPDAAEAQIRVFFDHLRRTY